MPDLILGFRQGETVCVQAKGAKPFVGLIRRVVVPKIGERFAVVEDGHGSQHHAYFSELSEHNDAA